MSFNQEPLFTHNITDEEFYACVDRLKAQGSLNKDSFCKQIPFFTFQTITKETHIRELFPDSCDPHTYKNLLKNIISTPEDSDSSDLISKRLSVMQVMGFAQIVLYKVLPCPDANCPNRPREIATHNQYKDYEYQCPFYHHERDRRRLVITPNIGEEFVYKANYFEEGKRSSDKEKYSQNYFESMFHPLYYKMFRCKREYCNFSQVCPFFHSEEEKKTWDKLFSNYIRKDRISYVKDKQKYYEKDEKRKNSMNQNASPVSEKQFSGKSAPRRTGPVKKLGRSDNNKNEVPLKNFQSKKWDDDWKKETEPVTQSLTSLPDESSPRSTASKDSKDSEVQKSRYANSMIVQ
jgi:hypothetical protein